MAQELPGGSGYFPGFPVLNIGFSLTWIVCLTVLSDFLWVNWVISWDFPGLSFAFPQCVFSHLPSIGTSGYKLYYIKKTLTI
jgi:hypothetical protein